MRVLLEKECCVCEVMQALDISQSRASRNLGILQDAGFLKSRRDGQWIGYYIDRNTTNRHAQSLTRLVGSSSLGETALKQDKTRLKGVVRKGPGCDRKR